MAGEQTRKNKRILIGLILLAAILYAANLLQFSNTVSHNRVIHRLDRNLLSELDSLRLELVRQPTPSILAVEQASKIAALSTFSTFEFDYGYTLETRVHEKFVHNEDFKDMDQIEKIISALEKDPVNKQLQRELDLLLVK